jgi:DNA modification methylase/superfamily II DNA or RNA helicase
MDYAEFLESKRIFDAPSGLSSVPALNPMLFPFQRDIVSWALKRGRAAIFADCGMGKTPMQLEWARCIPGDVLLVAPLAVSRQTIREAGKFGVHGVAYSGDGSKAGKITVTNYERMEKFDLTQYAGIVLDESSILKSYDGHFRKYVTDGAQRIPYRLACTATPAPNDLIELCNHSEFLSVMSGKEVIALFFKQDGNTTHNWRLKGHARQAFWKWLAQWSVAIRKPSDLGYDDGSFVLPPLNIVDLETEHKTPMDGFLFAMPASTLQERQQARRESVGDRVSACAEMVNASKESWIVWCNLNTESAALAKAIPDAVEVTGSDIQEHKEDTLIAFQDGKVRVLISKPSICGFGMNFQNCHNVAFVGLSDSYEQFYQAVRRCWRFGQKSPVTAHVITSSIEGAVVENIRRKEKQSVEMFDALVKEMTIYQTVTKQARNEMEYKTMDARGNDWHLMMGDSCERIKEIETDSVGLSVFSPPFPGMYAYTNSPRDIGNSTSIDEMMTHFSHMMPELLRVTMPGRNCCVHLMQLTSMLSRDGHVGLKDYRGAVIEKMERAGWYFAGEVTIDKNPQVQAVRNKERGLMFKSLANDSSVMRMALADYILLFRKPGDNPIPIRAGISSKYGNPDGWITEEEWIEWAAPVWYRRIDKDGRRGVMNYPGKMQASDGIMETDVLNVSCARDANDERHLCPLQLGVIERCVKLWSAPGDTVFSPFAGIGSEGYQSVRFGRKFLGIELKESYWKVACQNLTEIENRKREQVLL